MNRTKIIYFLSAFVLIIGCFALNKSYSLFVDTKSSETIEAPVPKLEAYLTLGDTDETSVVIEAEQEYLIQLKVTNPSYTSINYGIKANATTTNYTITPVTDGTNNYLSYGTSTNNSSLKANSNIYTYLVIKNNETTDITIDFELVYNYSTINIELSELTNINNDSLYTISIGGLPYSDNPDTLTYKIIENFVNSDLYTGAKDVDISSLFNNETIKVSLPIGSSSLNVPSPETFTTVETGEVGLYKAEDDYGTSYYFRGASSVNYVNFAGFTWRIVRINGDGSIRLILDGTLDKITKEGESSPVYQNTNLSALDSDGKIAFNSTYNDNAYLGYMYGTVGSTTYDATHQNLNDSTIKTYIDTFYKEYILEYQDYISDTMFCGDKSLTSSTIGSSNTALGYEKNKTYYATTERLYYSTGTTSITTATPTLECAKGATNTYSRYTVDSYTTTNGVNTNGDLTYPIALLSADELVMAGAFNRTANKSYYLYDAYANETSYNYWWTMTPYYFTGTYAIEFASGASSYSLYDGIVYNFLETYGSRPVINLKSDVLVSGGDGTSGDGAYTVKLAS